MQKGGKITLSPQQAFTANAKSACQASEVAESMHSFDGGGVSLMKGEKTACALRTCKCRSDRSLILHANVNECSQKEQFIPVDYGITWMCFHATSETAMN